MFHHKATSSPELPAADKVVSTMSDLINAGKFREAADIAALVVDRPTLYDKHPEYVAVNDDAQFHFHASLACRLAGRKGEASWYGLRARRCPNFSNDVEADLKRDDALWLIRQGRPWLPWRRKYWRREVRWLIDELYNTVDHVKDPLRYGALLMTDGRFEYAQGRYREALILFGGAEVVWDDCTEPNEQWARNNRFAMMRASAHTSANTALFARRTVRDEDEKNELRKRLARLLLNKWLPSRAIIMLYDIAERVMARR